MNKEKLKDKIKKIYSFISENNQIYDDSILPGLTESCESNGIDTSINPDLIIDILTYLIKNNSKEYIAIKKIVINLNISEKYTKSKSVLSAYTKVRKSIYFITEYLNYPIIANKFGVKYSKNISELTEYCDFLYNKRNGINKRINIIQKYINLG